MKRRKFVVGLGSLAAGGAAAMGTGAFSKMNSGERSVTVQVEDDANSFVALVPADEGDNEHGQFAEQNGDKLEINVDGSNTDRGEGVNPGSEYYIDNVFTIRNESAGPDDHYLWISSNTAERVDFYWGGEPSDTAEGSAYARKRSTGREVKVGMYVDATGLDASDTISGDVVISARNVED